MTKIFLLATSMFTTLFSGCGQTNGSSSKSIITSSDAIKIKVGKAPGCVEIADLNDDSNPDLAFANHERKYLTVLLGNGQGDFTAAPKSPFPVEVIPHTHGIATGDFNNDGRLDLVTDSWGNNQIEVYLAIASRVLKFQEHFLKSVNIH